MPDQEPKGRRGKSLVEITKKFLRLLQESENGTLDLKEAIKILAEEHGRRLYDITNVLEGVGLVSKISKCCVMWTGSSAKMEIQQMLTGRMMDLRSELRNLEQKETILDLQKFWIEESIRNTTEACSNLTYVNHDDICNCFSGRTILAVRAPTGTKLEVPIPKVTHSFPTKYQLYLKSINGPIEVLLLNKGSPSSPLLVLPVPPPEDVFQNARVDDGEKESPPCPAFIYPSQSTRFRQPAMKDMWTSNFGKAEHDTTAASGLRNISQEIEAIAQPTKEIMKADFLNRLLGSETMCPLIHPSSPPCKEGESFSDLFEIPTFKL